MSAVKAVLPPLVLLVLAAGVLIDLWSLFAWLRRNKFGHGPSGIAGAALFCYFPFCVLHQRFLLFVGLAGFHVCCQYLLPALQRRLSAPSE